MTPRALALVAAIGALGTVGAEAAEPHRRENLVEREIVLGPEVREVVIANTYGPVAVRSGEPGRVSFIVRQSVSSHRRDALDAASREISLVVDEEGDRLTLEQSGPWTCTSDGGPFRGCGWEPEYSVSWAWEVAVPAAIDLEVSTVNGAAVSVEGVAGRVRAANVNGAVRLTALAGDVAASSVNGDVRAELRRAPTADSSFETINGDVELSLPADASAELGMSSHNGEIYTDFAYAELPRRAEAATGLVGRYQYRLYPDVLVAIGAGGVRIYCGTRNGDVVVRAR